MFDNNDIAGKLKLINCMRILAGLFLLIELIAVGWVIVFYSLYSGPEIGSLSVSWLIFIGMMLPFNWPGAIICAVLSMVMPTNAVVVLTAAVLTVLTLNINRAVWAPNPGNYTFLVIAMRIEILKSIIYMMAGCFIALINADGIYMAVIVYEFGSACNILIFYKALSALDRMDYRGIFQMDEKRPYGQ